MSKPLGKMTKAELLALAKDNKDAIRTMDFKLTSLDSENMDLKQALQKAQEDNKLLKQKSNIDQKMLNRYDAQKKNTIGEMKIAKPRNVKVSWWSKVLTWCFK